MVGLTNNNDNDCNYNTNTKIIDSRTRAAAETAGGVSTTREDMFVPAPPPMRGGANATRWGKEPDSAKPGSCQTWSGSGQSALADTNPTAWDHGDLDEGDGSGSTPALWFDDFSSLPRPPTSVLASPPTSDSPDAPGGGGGAATSSQGRGGGGGGGSRSGGGGHGGDNVPFLFRKVPRDQGAASPESVGSQSSDYDNMDRSASGQVHL